MRQSNDLESGERSIVSLAVALGAEIVPGLSRAEIELARTARPVSGAELREYRDQIRDGLDPLGSALMELRSADVRRQLGATYTPPAIVKAMLAWAFDRPRPDRIVDPGVGSARFLVAAGHTFRKAELVGVEIDALAALIARANLATNGLAGRSVVTLADYLDDADTFPGRTLFLGNPPYVRHHHIDPKWKQWLTTKAASLKLKASQLAGLHVYFFLATAIRARPGDHGAFITAAEWLDVNYGQLVRELFLGRLGGQGVVVIEPTARAFPDAATTAAIATFEVATRQQSIRVRRVKRLRELDSLDGGRLVRRERLEAETRWSRLTHGGRECPEGFVELGEICRVHRGSVTGANDTWIAGEHSRGVPERFLFRSVTRARELIAAGPVLSDVTTLRCVVDLPDALDALDPAELAAVERFLRLARERGADKGYIATHRRAWWSVGLRAAAPMLATYMARRPPSFVRNRAEARHLNIAHGLYPRDPLNEDQMSRLVHFLSTGVRIIDGRTYSGGLTKFEPGEMERLFVPGPELLREATG